MRYMKLCIFDIYIFNTITVLVLRKYNVLPCQSPQWGTADAEIRVPSVKNPEPTNVLPVSDVTLCG